MDREVSGFHGLGYWQNVGKPRGWRWQRCSRISSQIASSQCRASPRANWRTTSQSEACETQQFRSSRYAAASVGVSPGRASRTTCSCGRMWLKFVEKSIQEDKCYVTGRVGKALGARRSRKGSKPHKRAAIVVAVHSSGDPDTPLAEWLENWSLQVWRATWKLQGSFQAHELTEASYEDMRRSSAQTDPLANFVNVVRSWSRRRSTN